MPMLQRAAGLNVVLVLAAVVVTTAVLAPGKVSTGALDAELVVVLVAVALVVLANVYLLRRVIGPVQSLTALAGQVDLTNLEQRLPDAEPTSEAGELALTFNDMLSRLETERRASAGRALRAQEAERLRIAQELHDQVGQELTAVLLGISRIRAQAPGELTDDVAAIQDAVRRSLEDVRRIAVELRPEALDDLGLVGALAILTERFWQQLGLEVRERIDDDLPALTPETELVVYRVAQEALTNVARHSASSDCELSLSHNQDELVLTVADHGLGLPPHNLPGTGLRGMRERASIIGARLHVGNRDPEPGCEVRLQVDVRGSGVAPRDGGEGTESAR